MRVSTLSVEGPSVHRSSAGTAVSSIRKSSVATSYLPQSILQHSEGLSVSQVVGSLVLSCVGVAVCLFPKKMDDAGYITAVPMFLFVCYLCRECGCLIALGCSVSEQLNEDGKPVTDYETLALVAGGPKWKALLTTSKNGALLGFVIVFIQFTVSSIAAFFSKGFRDTNQDLKPYIRFLVGTPIFMGMTLIKDLKQIAKLSSLGVAMVIIQVIGIVVGAVVHRVHGHACASEEEAQYVRQAVLNDNKDPPADACIFYMAFPEHGKEIGMIGSFLASAIFAFAVLSTIPSLRSQMEEPNKMPSALSSACLIVATLYACVMAFGYLGYGGAAPTNIVDALAADCPYIGKLVAAAILINCLISAPIFLYVVICSLEKTGQSVVHTAFTLPNVAARMFLIMLLSFIGYACRNINAVISLVSAFFCVCNNIYLPLLFFHMARRKSTSFGIHVPPLSSFTITRHVLMVVVGAFTMIFGASGAFATFAELGKLNRSTTTANSTVIE